MGFWVSPVRAGSIDTPSLDALRAALNSPTPPTVDWQDQTRLTLSWANADTAAKASGRCRSGRPVVVLGKALRDALVVACKNGRYVARAPGLREGRSTETIASQSLLDGTILAARSVPAASPQSSRPVRPDDLATALAKASPGDTIALEGGVYDGVRIDFPAKRGGEEHRPIIIDGRGATFVGKTRFQIAASHVVLRNFTFQDAGPAVLVITGPDVRITGGRFIRCGDAQHPKAECVIVTAGGAHAEIDFNSFSASTSMSIKVRAGPDGSRDQPFDAWIHHNVFHDITRLAQNGQEPIQVAGPNGGASAIDLRTRIEFNVFYRTDGDRETVSMKTPGTRLRWNTFRDMDAAPNLRGSHDSEMSDNILLRTRPVRIAGNHHRITGNILVCPRDGIGFIVSHGTPGYDVTADSVIRDNTVVATKIGVLIAPQTLPMEVAAHDNRIVQNRFYLPKSGTLFRVRPENAASEIMSRNISGGSQRREQGSLCP